MRNRGDYSALMRFHSLLLLPVLANLTTKSRLERTPSGVGVGATLTQLRAGLKGETCKKEFGVHHCWIGNWEPGRVISDFRLVRDRVSVVAVGYVFD